MGYCVSNGILQKNFKNLRYRITGYFKQIKDLYFGKEQVKWTTGKSLCFKLPGSHAADYNKTARRSVKLDASRFTYIEKPGLVNLLILQVDKMASGNKYEVDRKCFIMKAWSFAN